MTQHERVEVRELLIGTLCSYLYNTIVYCLLLLDQYRDLQLNLLNLMTSQLKNMFFLLVFVGFILPG